MVNIRHIRHLCQKKWASFSVIDAGIVTPLPTVVFLFFLSHRCIWPMKPPYLLQDGLAATWDGIYYAVLVYDVSSQESFESCKEWLEELKKARYVSFLCCVQPDGPFTQLTTHYTIILHGNWCCLLSICFPESGQEWQLTSPSCPSLGGTSFVQARQGETTQGCFGCDQE